MVVLISLCAATGPSYDRVMFFFFYQEFFDLWSLITALFWLPTAPGPLSPVRSRREDSDGGPHISVRGKGPELWAAMFFVKLFTGVGFFGPKILTPTGLDPVLGSQKFTNLCIKSAGETTKKFWKSSKIDCISTPRAPEPFQKAGKHPWVLACRFSASGSIWAPSYDQLSDPENFRTKKIKIEIHFLRFFCL